MMTPTALVQGVVLPASVATQYTAPSAARVLVKHVVFTNTTSGAITVSAYVVPQYQAAAASNKVIDAYSINAHTAYVSPELSGVVMNAGDTLQCFAGSGSSISMGAYGIVQS